MTVRKVWLYRKTKTERMLLELLLSTTQGYFLAQASLPVGFSWNLIFVDEDKDSNPNIASQINGLRHNFSAKKKMRSYGACTISNNKLRTGKP